MSNCPVCVCVNCLNKKLLLILTLNMREEIKILISQAWDLFHNIKPSGKIKENECHQGTMTHENYTILQAGSEDQRHGIQNLKVQNLFILELSFGQLLREMTCFLYLT